MAFEKTKDYILSNLGYPTVSVELTERQLEWAIREACERWFEYRTPKLRYHMMTVVPGQDTVQIPLEAIHPTPQGIKISSVIYNPSDFESFQYFFQYTLYNYQPVQIANIYMMFQNLESFKLATGQFVSWEIVDGDKIRIGPIPKSATTIAVVYSTQDEDSNLDNNLWIWKMSLARAKQTLGLVRSKWSIPSPNGSTIDMNGADLKNEGKTEETELMNELMQKSEPMGIIIG